MARRTDVERVEEYIQHQRQALEACTGDSGKDRSRPWLKNTLATFYGETNHFQETHRLLQVTMMIQKRQRLAPQTILTYLACLKKFVDYLVIRDNIDAARIHAAMNEVKSIYTTSAACDSRRKADERFKLVSSHNIVVTRHEQVLKLLQENVEEESLSLKEEKALNYFLPAKKSANYELDLGNARGNPTKRVGFDEQTQNRPILRRRPPCGA